MAISPVSPEGKLLRVLCDMRADQGFLTPERLSEATGLHVQLVRDALVELEARGAVGKEDNLLEKMSMSPARGYWWKPTLKGYEELNGEAATVLLKAKVLSELEQQTKYLPDADATQLGQLYVNFGLIANVLEELEQQGLASSKPSLTFSGQLRWELTGQGARVLEQARSQTLAGEHSLGV